MAVILLVILAAAASAAPSASDGYREWQQEMDRMEFNKPQEGYPAKRSSYGSVYVSPCAAAASASAYPVPAAHVPVYPSPSPYYGHPAYPTVHPHHGYVSPVSPPYPHRYYRMEEDPENEQETMGMDMNQMAFDQMPMARSSYGPAPVINAGPASGPVVGVFSNANTGGCSVPLLVSCTPSISHGQIAKSHPYYSNYHAGAYRDVEDIHHGETEEHQEQAHVASEQLPQHSKSTADKTPVMKN